MNRPLSQVLIALFSAAAVVLIAVVDSGKPMPGPLSAVHEAVPELSGGQDCTLCHGGVFNTMAEACLDCHDFVEQQAESGQGLHGLLGEERLTQCALCHSEHHGSRFAMVNRQSFAQAGTSGPDEFDHSLIGYERLGKHLELSCSECHENADIEVLAEGDRRFVGLDKACSTCHEDPHEGKLPNDCTTCHSQEGFETRQFEGHDQWLALTGGHATASCLDCHAEGEQHALDIVLRGNSARRSCADCHESPHTEAFVRAEAEATGRSADTSCRSCHESEHTSFRAEELELELWQHTASGFPLAAPHAEVACEDCHAPELSSFEQRHPGRSATDCGACHEAPHGDQFTSGPQGATQCLECHNTQHFEPHEFTAEVHSQRAMQLVDSHASLECSECHLDPIEDNARLFRGTPTECAACHVDSHRGFFEQRAHIEGRKRVSDCDECHTPTSFSDGPGEHFDHGLWTGFDVRGSHAQNGCESCHIPAAAPDEHGRSFGRVSDHFGEAEGCVKCHGDPHQGSFALEHLPRQVDGRELCSRCHDEVSFRTQPYGFDHGVWTDFALRGAHLELRCTACHEPMRRADEHGRTWKPAAGKQCADCHADPHGGQFNETDLVGEFARCDRCHTETAEFADSQFDHDTDSEFPLEEHHATLECVACHQPVPIEGVTIVRYKPLGMECIDCHGVQERALLRRKRRRP